MDPVTLSEAAADHGLAILLYGVLSDAAQRHGLPVKPHAEQLSDQGGAALVLVDAGTGGARLLGQPVVAALPELTHR